MLNKIVISRAQSFQIMKCNKCWINAVRLNYYGDVYTYYTFMTGQDLKYSNGMYNLLSNKISKINKSA